MKNLLKKLAKIGVILAIILTIAIVGINVYYHQQLQIFTKNFTDIDTLEKRPAALILGAGLRKDATPSTILEDRLEVGHRLLESHKIDKLILSGDNRVVGYNEPDAMKKYLVEKGVPEKILILDYAGRRTYDSCYRAQKIFNQQKIYVVTQNFHITRALYLCRSLDIDTIGVTSDLQEYRNNWLNEIRDSISFCVAVLDIKVFKPLPILGERVEVE